MRMTNKTYPSRVADQFVVRMPDGMRDRLAAEAERGGRSMNAEIVQRLQASLDGAAGDAVAELRLYKQLSSGSEVLLAALCRYVLALVEEIPPEGRARSEVVALAEPFARSYLARDAGLPMALVRLAGLQDMADVMRTAKEVEHFVKENPPVREGEGGTTQGSRVPVSVSPANTPPRRTPPKRSSHD